MTQDNNNSVSNALMMEQLAIDRTNLGNTRTFLAMIRTAIALLGLGASFLKFLTHTFFHTIGYLSIALSILLLIFGIFQFVSYKIYLVRLAATANQCYIMSPFHSMSVKRHKKD